MRFNLAILPGDGVGPEIVREAVKILDTIADEFGHNFELEDGLIGAVAIDETGRALPEDTFKLCQCSDAVLLAAVGDPRYDDPQIKIKPEDGLLSLRKKLELFANLRPVRVYPVLVNNTALKPEVIKDTDFVIVRELTGGLYFGEPKRQWETALGRRAVDTMSYSEEEIERLIRVGFELAKERFNKLVSVDKANVLQASRLWRQIATEVAKDYPNVALEHMLVDACAMRIIQNPRYFDVMVMENTFGDILSDEASMLAGSMGMLPSASLAGVPQEGKRIFGLYEPVHGSAPDIAGKSIVNPVAIILSVAMMLRYSFGLEKEARAVETAVEQVLSEGYYTRDIMGTSGKEMKTEEMGDLIMSKVGG